MREKNQPRSRMPFPDFSAHGQRAKDIAQRAGPANDDNFFSMAQALKDKPKPKNDDVKNAVCDGANGLFEWFHVSPGKA
jgi:hypothetical protein